MTTYHPNGSTESLDIASDAPLRDRLRDQVDTNLDAARDLSDSLQRDMGKALDRAGKDGAKFVRENPGTALVGSLGIGVLIGLMLRSRR